MQVWSDATLRLRKMWRVLKNIDGRIALGFTPYSAQSSNGLTEMLTTAGFTKVQLVKKERGFCALAIALY
jgi:hypothetical protein